jgi:NAD(P)-dependent dehydrogenase (short-subunit alcohol dehydrogenase family)
MIASPTHPAGTSALVTGGGSGLGLACAQRLAGQGVHVVLAGRQLQRLDAAVGQITSAGGAATPVVCDVSDEAQVANAAAVASAAGDLRVVVTSAGVGAAGPLHLTDVSTWNEVLATNLTGTMLTLKHTADALARAGGASFVAISSIAGPLTHRHLGAAHGRRGGGGRLPHPDAIGPPGHGG